MFVLLEKCHMEIQNSVKKCPPPFCTINYLADIFSENVEVGIKIKIRTSGCLTFYFKDNMP